jgi:Helix-hairpin-helix motif
MREVYQRRETESQGGEGQNSPRSIDPMPQRRPESRSNWPWISIIPLGLGAWAPIYAGVQAGNARWRALGALWSALVVAGWAVAIASNGGAASGFLLIVGWAGAVATSFAIRPEYERLTGSSFDRAVLDAEGRLSARERALRLARENPALAREAGVGRPDLPGSADGGLVDVNNAPASALARLPGVDDALATRIVEGRTEAGGFSSVEDLGATLDLDASTVDALREVAVFLPRRA